MQPKLSCRECFAMRRWEKTGGGHGGGNIVGRKIQPFAKLTYRERENAWGKEGRIWGGNNAPRGSLCQKCFARGKKNEGRGENTTCKHTQREWRKREREWEAKMHLLQSARILKKTFAKEPYERDDILLQKSPIKETIFYMHTAKMHLLQSARIERGAQALLSQVFCHEKTLELEDDFSFNIPLCIYIYTYMYIYIYTYIHIYTCRCIHTCIYIHIQRWRPVLHTYIYIYIYTYICVYICICIYIHIGIHIVCEDGLPFYILEYLYMYACTYLHVHIYM